MSILSIDHIELDSNNTVYVRAVVEDAALLYPQTWDSPEEYCSGVCEASFEISEDDILPDNDLELIQYLEDLDLSWELVDNDNSDYDIGLTD